MPINPSKNKLEDIESGNDILKNLTRFTDSMLNSNATLSQKHWFKSIFFPLSFVLELISSLFKIFNFIKLDNKNLGNSSNLILALISTILTLIAVVCFFAGIFSVAVGICLVTSMGLGILFNFSLLIYNFFQFNRLKITEKNNKIKALNQLNCFKYGSGLLVGFITLSYFVRSAFFPLSNNGILVGIGIFTGIIVLMSEFYKLATYQYYKNENYCEQLTNDLSMNRAYLLTVIFKKINFLEHEIEKIKKNWANKFGRKNKNLSKKLIC